MGPARSYDEYRMLQGQVGTGSSSSGGNQSGFIATERIRLTRKERPEFPLMAGYEQMATDLELDEEDDLDVLARAAGPLVGGAEVALVPDEEPAQGARRTRRERRLEAQLVEADAKRARAVARPPARRHPAWRANQARCSLSRKPSSTRAARSAPRAKRTRRPCRQHALPQRALHAARAHSSRTTTAASTPNAYLVPRDGRARAAAFAIHVRSARPASLPRKTILRRAFCAPRA